MQSEKFQTIQNRSKLSYILPLNRILLEELFPYRNIVLMEYFPFCK